MFAANASHCFLSYTSGPKIGDVSAPFDSFSDPIYGVDGLSMLAQLTFKVLSKTNELFSISKISQRTEEHLSSTFRRIHMGVAFLNL